MGIHYLFNRFSRKARLAVLCAGLVALTGCSSGGGSSDNRPRDNDVADGDNNGITITTRAYNQQVEVSWESQGDHSYTLYWSHERDFDLDSHASSSGAGSALGVTSPHRVTGLENRRNWYFRVEADDGTVSPARGAFPGPPTFLGNSSADGALQEASEHLFLGDRFTGGAVLNEAAMLVQRANGFAAESLGIGGVVRQIVADGEGGYFVGGRMRVGGTEDLVLVRVDADLQVDPDWLIQSTGSFDYVRTIALDAERVYVGGTFSDLNGINQAYLAALTLQDAQVDTTFDPILDGMVWDIALLADRVMIAGEFESVSNDPNGERFAVLNRSGGLIDPQPPTGVDFSQEWASSLAVFDDAVLLAGSFTGAGPAGDSDHLLRITADGEVASVDIETSGGGIALVAASRTHLAIAGGFDTVNGEQRNLLAVFDSDLNLLPANPFSEDDILWAPPQFWDGIRLHGGRVYLTNILDERNLTNGVTEVDPETGLTAFAPAPSAGGVTEVVPYDDDLLLVAGGQGIASGFRERGLLALDRDGNFSPTFRLGIRNDDVSGVDVRGMAVDAADRLYVTGQFTGVGDVRRNGAFAVDPDGRIVNSWAPNLGDDSRRTGWALQLGLDDRIYLGGSFSEVNGDTTVHDLTALSMATGQVAPGFAPSLNNEVRTMAFWDAYLAVAGTFSTADEEARELLAVYDDRGGLVDWEPSHPDDANVREISAGSRGFFLGGDFGSLEQDVYLRNLAYFGPAAAGGFEPIQYWRPAPDDRVLAITQIGETVWVGGRFSSIADQDQALLAPLDEQTGGLDAGRAPDIDGSDVHQVAAFGELVCFTGSFSRVGGKSFRDFACIDGETGEPVW